VPCRSGGPLWMRSPSCPRSALTLPWGTAAASRWAPRSGLPLTAVEPRIRAAIFGGGFFVYEELMAAARRITVPVQFLLPWDDEYVDRASTLALFDAFASQEKTLHANPGDHRTIRWVGIDQEFLPRHLGRAGKTT